MRSGHAASLRSVGRRARRRGDGGALIDRLIHHCHIVNIRGNSYYMREHRDLLRTGRADQDARRSGVI